MIIVNSTLVLNSLFLIKIFISTISVYPTEFDLDNEDIIGAELLYKMLE